MRIKINFDNDKQFKYFRGVFFLLILAILLMTHYDVKGPALGYAILIAVVWGLGLGKIILRLFGI